MQATEEEMSRRVPVGGASILVVDDEDFVRRIVGRLLEKAGYRVALARDGSDALGVLGRSAGGFDLVLTDVHMPGMAGPELWERTRRTRPGLPFIFMTGRPRAALPSGGGDLPPLLLKPFGWGELETAVKNALAHHASIH